MIWKQCDQEELPVVCQHTAIGASIVGSIRRHEWEALTLVLPKYTAGELQSCQSISPIGAGGEEHAPPGFLELWVSRGTKIQGQNSAALCQRAKRRNLMGASTSVSSRQG